MTRGGLTLQADGSIVAPMAGVRRLPALLEPRPVTAMTDATQILLTLRSALPGLQAEWPIRSLALFGSRMRQDSTAQSDLDVLVEFAAPVPLSAFLALEDRLAAITGLRVDLVSAAALKPRIGEHVKAEAVLL